MNQEYLIEPNFKEFEYNGYKCEIIRSPNTGALCGYVLVPKTSKLYGMSKEFFKDIKIHGGITCSNSTDYPFDYWSIGFDCSHYNDYIPKKRYERN